MVSVASPMAGEHIPLHRLDSAELGHDELKHLAGCDICRKNSKLLKRVDPAVADGEPDGSCTASASGPSVADAPADDSLLAQGREVERYIVEALIGRGGTGMVYRVRHSRLGTVHALKVVTVQSPDIEARLIAEGRAQGTLAHDRVVTVTDVVDVDGTPGLIMEYVEGPSLRGFLRSHRPTIAQIDALVVDILAGVADAHRNGFVHRDLKPGNILLQPKHNGLVAKVADFGLAKALRTGGSADMVATRTGATMGTPAYMAPEQIRDASSVDARADVFALGAIMYELVTGRRAFDGRDVLAVMNQVCKAERTPARELAPDAPARMCAAIDAALVVDPDERVATCQELLALWTDGAKPSELIDAAWDANIVDQVRGLRSDSQLPRSAASTGSRPGSYRWLAAAAFGLVGLAAVGWLALPAKSDLVPQASPAPVATKPAALGFDVKVRRIGRTSGLYMHPSLSADGKQIVYSNDVDIYLRRVVGDKAFNLTKSFGPRATQPELSPSGDHIAFAAEGAIYIMGVAGDNIRKIASPGYWPTWSPDGKHLAYVSLDLRDVFMRPDWGAELRRVDVETGTTKTLVTSEHDARQPDWSPDGKWIIFFGSGGLHTVRADGTGYRKVGVSAWHPVWDPDGGGFFAVRARLGQYEITRFLWDAKTGTSSHKTATKLFSLSTGTIWHFSFSRDKRRWMASVQYGTTRTWRVPFDARTRKVTGLPRQFGDQDLALQSPAASPDGKWVAAQSNWSHEEHIYVVDAATGTKSRRLTGMKNEYRRAPHWSPDGKTIAYFGSYRGSQGVILVNPQGGEQRRISPKEDIRFPHWSPDGKRLVITYTLDDNRSYPCVVDLNKD